MARSNLGEEYLVSPASDFVLSVFGKVFVDGLGAAVLLGILDVPIDQGARTFVGGRALSASQVGCLFRGLVCGFVAWYTGVSRYPLYGDICGTSA